MSMPPWYVEKPFPFKMTGWATHEERGEALKVLYEIIPADSQVVISREDAYVEIILGNSELTHEEWANEMVRRVNNLFKERGVQGVRFERYQG